MPDERDGVHTKKGADSPEEIRRCLSCDKPVCDNCLQFGKPMLPVSKYDDELMGECIRAGMSNLAIAARLKIGVAGIKNYRTKWRYLHPDEQY